MRRSLIYYWRTNLAVAAGAAVTAAVVTGALLVGDSMRGSLRALTLDRLGRIHLSLQTRRLFREDLLATLPERLESFRIVPLLALSGSASHSGSGARASRVSIYGVDDRFHQAFPELPVHFNAAPAPTFMPAVINESLQGELGARVGDQLLLRMARPSDVHPEFLLGSRDPGDLVETARVQLVGVLSDRGPGRFSLRPHQSAALNLYVPLSRLQRALARAGRVNTLLVAGPSPESPPPQRLQQLLGEALGLEDLNLTLRPSGGRIIVESREMMIPPVMDSLIRAAARSLNWEAAPVLTYLANRVSAGSREFPYSTVSALDPAAFRDRLTLASGDAVSPLAGGEILLTEWAARDLEAAAGDRVTLEYFEVGPREELLTRRAEFELAGVAAMQGLAVERDLTPPIPGVQEAQNMSDWDPPVPIELERIRDRDERYWDLHGAAPKAFVALEAGTRLWASRFGRSTSLWIAPPPGVPAGEASAHLARAILQRGDPESAGFRFEPVRSQGLEAASGATDFGVLFLSFSSFLIVSAALLVGLLFRLNLEQRAGEMGLLLAVGFSSGQIRRRYLGEGMLLAAAGSVPGVAASAGYGWLMIEGLRSWWSAAVGGSFLSLHVEAASLATGLLVSLAVVFFSILGSVRRLCRKPATQLLAGSVSDPGLGAVSRTSRILAWGGALAALLLLAAALATDPGSVGLFMGVGASALASALAFYSMWLQTSHPTLAVSRSSLLVMAGRNSARYPGRSLLSTALVAFASFVIVAVGASRHEPGEELMLRDSGAGGFSLLGRSDIPLLHDLSSPEERFELGFSEQDSGALEHVEIAPFRLLEGEDVSCLNLYQPSRPRILGASRDMIRRGGFSFARLSRPAENPWSLLEEDLGEGVVPAFGDLNSVVWILKLSLGDDLVLEDEQGAPLRLRLVGLLSRSIFQGEIIVSEENFLRHFPGQRGFSYFLIDAPASDLPRVGPVLERSLDSFGMDVSPATEVLSGYLAVENTYLSTFQTLGGLGLLLGTVGLGVVLARNILERRGELATLRAFGFERSRLAWLVLAENSFLLLLGTGVGTLSALLAVAPHLAGAQSPVPWQSLLLTLLAVLLAGLGAGIVAVRRVLKMALLPALKAE